MTSTTHTTPERAPGSSEKQFYPRLDRIALTEIARPILQILIDTLHRLDEQIALLDREIVQRAKGDETAHRLMTIPGIGPVTAVALTALAPSAQTFRRGRDFAAWMGLPLGLPPLQHWTGGKQKLGATSKMGERT